MFDGPGRVDCPTDAELAEHGYGEDDPDLPDDPVDRAVCAADDLEHEASQLRAAVVRCTGRPEPTPYDDHDCAVCRDRWRQIVSLEEQAERLERWAHGRAQQEGRVCRDELCWEPPTAGGWCEDHRGGVDHERWGDGD